MNRRLLGIGILAAMTLTGCASSGAGVANGPAAGAVEAESITELGYRTQWIQNLALPAGSRLQHARVLGDRLVTLDRNNVVTVIHGGDGRVLWSGPVGRTVEVFSEPVRFEKVLMLQSQSRAFAFNIDTGEALSQIPLTFASNVAPLVVGEQFISGSPTGMLFSQDLQQGILRWNYKMESAIATPPVLAGPSVIVTTQAGHVAAFNPANGALIWRERTFDRITAPPAVTDAHVFVASEDQSLYAYDRASGRMMWRYYTDTALDTSPFVVTGSELVLQRVRGDIIALNIITGAVIWRLENFRGLPVIVRNGAIYFHDGDRVILVNVADGKVIRTVGVDGVQKIFNAGGKDGGLYLQRANSQFTKLVPR